MIYTSRMIGQDLRQFRKKLNLTQEEFAKQLSVAPNTVARWERDERAIPPHLPLALEALEARLSKINKQTQ